MSCGDFGVAETPVGEANIESCKGTIDFVWDEKAVCNSKVLVDDCPWILMKPKKPSLVTRVKSN